LYSRTQHFTEVDRVKVPAKKVVWYVAYALLESSRLQKPATCIALRNVEPLASFVLLLLLVHWSCSAEKQKAAEACNMQCTAQCGAPGIVHAAASWMPGFSCCCTALFNAPENAVMPIATLDVILGTVRISFLQRSRYTAYQSARSVPFNAQKVLQGGYVLPPTAACISLQAGHCVSVQIAACCTSGVHRRLGIAALQPQLLLLL
jgi:hypothetical protein